MKHSIFKVLQSDTIRYDIQIFKLSSKTKISFVQEAKTKN